MDLINYIKTSPLVRVKQSTRYPELSVVKYAKQVFYKNLWNEELEHCRGLVLDRDYKVVSYPFTKIYNYGIEARAPHFAENENLVAYEKVNGFMAAITWYKDDILVSTTGSLDSDFVGYVYDYLDLDAARATCSQFPHYTFLFECVHPSDPHIIPEAYGLYLLGSREKVFGSCIYGPNTRLANAFNAYMPRSINGNIDMIKRSARETTREGYVFYAKDGRAAKIKSPYYLTQKFVARCNNMEKLMRPDIKASMDEEYYGLIDQIQANIEAFANMDEQARLLFCREILENGA